MKGSNSISLNQATMIEAMQFYLDSVFTNEHRRKVKSVKQESSGYGGGESFEVCLDDAKEDGPAQ